MGLAELYTKFELKIYKGVAKRVNTEKTMPSKALQVWFLVIHSASNGLDGGTGCKFFYIIQLYRPICGCVAYSFHMIHERTLLKSGFLQLGHIAPWDHRILVGQYEIIITFRPP